jgi:ribulose-5-phosphate 4-epimerase/fuculose-1-phosphate aldolase
LIGAYEESAIGYGNISQEFDGSDFEFIITGTQTGELAHLEPKYYSKITKIDFKKFTTYATGVTKPSSEAITHATIYKISPKIKAVIHIHNEKLWRYMLANEYL